MNRAHTLGHKNTNWLIDEQATRVVNDKLPYFTPEASPIPTSTQIREIRDLLQLTYQAVSNAKIILRDLSSRTYETNFNMLQLLESQLQGYLAKLSPVTATRGVDQCPAHDHAQSGWQ